MSEHQAQCETLKILYVIAGFRREVDEACALLGYTVWCDPWRWDR